MRTTAGAERSSAAASRASAANRRGRTAAPPESVAAATEAADRQPAAAQPQPVAVTAVRMLKLEEGLYALRIGELVGSRSDVDGMTVPVAHVAAPFAEDGNGVEIVAAFPRRGPWIGQEGGTVILRSPLAGGYAVVTAYAAPGEQAAELSLDLRRLDRSGLGEDQSAAEPARAGDTAPAGPLTGTRDVPSEILLHIERTGDRLFPGRGWVGALGRRLRIEAYTMRPLERLNPGDIELKGYLPNGGETPWVPGGVLCGTRGRGLPLIGFAVRIVPQRADRFEVTYQGSFFAGGISTVRRNGEPCRAATADDPLEAINVRIVERVPETEAAGGA